VHAAAAEAGDLAGRRAQEPVRRGDARDAVGEVTASAVDGGDLEVLGVGVVHLAIAGDHLALHGTRGQQRRVGQPVHAGHERAEVALDDEIRAVALEPSTGPGAPEATRVFSSSGTLAGASARTTTIASAAPRGHRAGARRSTGGGFHAPLSALARGQ
jgi:hypothetical protein